MRSVSMRPMTDSLSLAFLSVCEWSAEMWQKCLATCGTRLVGTLRLALAMVSCVLLFGRCVYVTATCLFVGAQWIVPDIRPENVSRRHRGVLMRLVVVILLILIVRWFCERFLVLWVSVVITGVTGIALLGGVRGVLRCESASRLLMTRVTCCDRVCRLLRTGVKLGVLLGLTRLRQLRSIASGACSLREMPVMKLCCIRLSCVSMSTLCMTSSCRLLLQGTTCSVSCMFLLLGEGMLNSGLCLGRLVS